MTTTDRIVGASIWEQEMYDHLSAHGQIEGEILEAYADLAADEDRSPAFRYLAAMILEDERRHHQTFEDLAEAIRAMGELRSDDLPIPRVSGLRHDKEAVLALTERLLSVERGDAKELKRLAKELKTFEDTTLWVLLLDLMRHDTDKHIKILKFIRDRAKDKS